MTRAKTDAPQTRLTVAVHPGARRSEIGEFKEGVLYVRIAAPPVEGKANRALVEFLAEILDVAKSDICIEKGLTGRRKVVLIRGVALDVTLKKLNAGP